MVFEHLHKWILNQDWDANVIVREYWKCAVCRVETDYVPREVTRATA